MDPQSQEFALQIARDVTEAVKRDVTAALKEHVTDVVTGAEGRLADQARVNVEAVREEARLAAEGYTATVQSIERRLDRIKSRLETTFTLYDAVLKNHNERMATLENANRGRQ